MATREKKGTVSPVSADVIRVLRSMAQGLTNAHPEIWANWPTIVGPEIARRAVPKSLRGKMLVISVSSSPWMQELSYIKEEILDRLADAVGPGVVEKLRLELAAEPRSWPRQS